jgi:hypothetical protein
MDFKIRSEELKDIEQVHAILRATFPKGLCLCKELGHEHDLVQYASEFALFSV